MSISYNTIKTQSNSATKTKDYHKLPVNTLLGPPDLITLLLKFIWSSRVQPPQTLELVFENMIQITQENSPSIADNPSK